MATVGNLRSGLEGSLNRSIMRAGGPEKYWEDNFFQYVAAAYSLISEHTREPVTISLLDSVAGQASYDLPATCFDNFDGIISVEYNLIPVHLNHHRNLEEKYYDEWRAPPDVSGVQYYIQYGGEKKIFFVNAPDATTDEAISIEHVTKTATPTADTDLIPGFAEIWMQDIQDYVLGRILKTDRSGRGSVADTEFTQKLLARRYRKNRETPRRVGTENISGGLKSFWRGYGRGPRRKGF